MNKRRKFPKHWQSLLLSIGLLLFASPLMALIFNNPYPESDALKKIYYSSFTEQPKTLDPARSYSSNEYQFISQIYEPVLQYDYFKRPYTLVPLAASSMPLVHYLDAKGQPVDKTNPTLAYSVYTIRLKPGILYQPHPAFAKNKKGEYRYLHVSPDFLDDNDINQLADFKYTSTREMTADDFIYEIKRLADPAVSSSIYGLMSDYIVGFRDFASLLPATRNEETYVDLRLYPLAGLHKINDYTFEITIKGQYPQFFYWLAMPFFAPIPWEVDQFYSQAGMDDKNLSFDWYPVGTGPFMLTENNPNRRMLMLRNPNYRSEFFPTNASTDDIAAGFTKHIGETIPMIDEAMYMLEKETIPRWNKYLQGYYDLSGISADSYDQAIQIQTNGEVGLTPAMQSKKMQLTQTTDPSVYYLGFNMLDPIVGGSSARARKLRQAISIAVNYDENIAIFFNGRGHPAQGPIPPGIFGYREGEQGINPYVYRWVHHRAQRKDISEAQQLMKEAGYPNGINQKTGKPLMLHYDLPITGGPDDKAQLDWMRKQFAKIGINLNIRGTQYNRFQDKMRNGNAQIFSWGWNADYPDPENFLFMLYGANGKVKHGGENAANYDNPEYDKLFDVMKNHENDDTRQAIIDKMLALLRYDSPWVWGINTQTFILSQQWVSLTKPNTISLNSLKYVDIDVPLRNQMRREWNQPILWPLGLLAIIVLLFIIPLLITAFRRERKPALRKPS